MLMKLLVLCAMVAIAATIPSDFNNDVIFKGRRAAAASPCQCKPNKCTVVAPVNGVLGGCAAPGYDGKAPTAGTATTCTPKCNTGYILDTHHATSSCKDGVFTSAKCIGKPCTNFVGVKVPANGNVGTCHTSVKSGEQCQVGCTAGSHSLDSDTRHYLCTNGKGSAIGKAGVCVANCAALTDGSSEVGGTHGKAGTCTLARGLAGAKCTSTCATGWSLKAGTGSFSCPATGKKWQVKVAPVCVPDCAQLGNGALGAGKYGVKGAPGTCGKEKALLLLDGKTKTCKQSCTTNYALKTGTGTYTCDPATGKNWKPDANKAAVCLRKCALPTRSTPASGWHDAHGKRPSTGGCANDVAFTTTGTCQTECNCAPGNGGCFVRQSGGKFTCAEAPDGSSNTATRDAALVCAPTCKQLDFHAAHTPAQHVLAAGTCDKGEYLKKGATCTADCNANGFTLKANTGTYKCTAASPANVYPTAVVPAQCHKKCKLVTHARSDGSTATGIPAHGGAVSPVVKDAKDCNADANGYLKPGETCQVKCPVGKKMQAGKGICTCKADGSGVWTAVAANCQADPVCDLSVAPANGNVGTCSASIAANGNCQQGCSSGYHVVGTTKCGTSAAATCSYACDPTCATGNSCIKENDKSSCTSCATHYTYTAAKGQKYGTCTLKLGVITLTQAVSINANYISKTQFSGVRQSGFEVAYGKLLGIWKGPSSSIVGKYKSGCSITSAATGSRRSSTVISFKAVVSAILSSYAYGIARKPFTKAQFEAALHAITDDHNNADPTGKVTNIGAVGIKWSSASTTSITGFLSLLVAAWCWTQQ